MFPGRVSEGDRNTLPPISALSAHSNEFHRAESQGLAVGARALRAPPTKAEPPFDDPMRGRMPPTSLEHHRTPPNPILQRPQHELEPFRVGTLSQPGDDAYGPPSNANFGYTGPPPPFRRDLERGSPVSDEVAWRSRDRPHSRFGAKESYSPHMFSALHATQEDGKAWPRSLDDPHRSRMPAPSAPMDEDESWRTGFTPRDRPDMHPEALAHERAREDERWRDERGARHMYPHEAGHGHPPMPSHPRDVRGGVRPLDVDGAEDGRRIRRRATSSLAEEECDSQRYRLPGPRPYGQGTYSPPDLSSRSTVHEQAPTRPGMLAGMDPPRPASTLGVTPSAHVVASAPPTPAAATANTVNANRRVAHLLSEQKRRESINTGFEDLRQAIPACRDGQDSKATILKRALEYIRELESIVERQQRPSLEGHPLGGYSNRSPPDDKDNLRRFGRPGGDEGHRGTSSGRQATGSGSSNSDAGSGHRIGGLPSNAFVGGPNGYTPAYTSRNGNQYPPYGSPTPMQAFNAPSEAGIRALNGSSAARGPMAGRRDEDLDEGRCSPSRRRVSDGDKDNVQRSPAGANYIITNSTSTKSLLVRSPTLEKPRDWHSHLDNKSLVDSAVRV